MPLDPYIEDVVPVPRSALRLPLELPAPKGFRPEEPSTWPKVIGRLEYVQGRLLFMPPSGDVQQDVAWTLPTVLEPWLSQHPELVAGGNEAGMLLAGEVRAADGAVWRRKDVEPRTGGFRRAAPLLAIEIAGRDDTETSLREKAAWYLARGVGTVWLILPDSREVVVLGGRTESRHREGEKLLQNPDLPGLEPEVGAFFRQLR